MPSTASSPSMRAQSCSRWYFSSSGYDSSAAMSGLLRRWINRLLDDACTPRTSTDVDRQLGTRRDVLDRNVGHADPPVQHRRVRPRRDLTAAGDRHTAPRNGALLHHERDELLFRCALLDLAKHLHAGEVLLECAAPAKTRGHRVGLGRDVLAV